MDGFHLAQINTALARAPLTDPSMQEFIAAVDSVNKQAEASPGFIWRYDTDLTEQERLVFGSANMLVNVSVWEDVQALQDYVYKSMHLHYLRRKQEWFEKTSQVHLALWWIPVGHLPDLEEARSRLLVLQESGSSPRAFTFAKPFAPGPTPVQEESTGE